MRSLVQCSLFVLAAVAMVFGQAPAPGGGSARTEPSAATPSAADAAVLANIQFVKGANGTWKCVGVSGKPCSVAEAQGVTKSRSNVKNNLTINITSDGTVHCFRASDNQSCSDPEIQAITGKYDLKSNGPHPGSSQPSSPSEPVGKAAAPAPKAGK